MTADSKSRVSNRKYSLLAPALYNGASAKLLLFISGIVITDLALVSAVSRCLVYMTFTAYRTATVVRTSSLNSGRNFSNSYDDSVELWLCRHVVRTKEADQPSITPEKNGRDIKRITFGISGYTAVLPAYLPCYVLEIGYHIIAPPACGTIYLTMALWNNEDGGVDLINGHYWTSDSKLALKQWQTKDLQPCHTAVCSIINEPLQGKLVEYGRSAFSA